MKQITLMQETDASRVQRQGLCLLFGGLLVEFDELLHVSLRCVSVGAVIFSPVCSACLTGPWRPNGPVMPAFLSSHRTRGLNGRSNVSGAGSVYSRSGQVGTSAPAYHRPVCHCHCPKGPGAGRFGDATGSTEADGGHSGRRHMVQAMTSGFWNNQHDPHLMQDSISSCVFTVC